MNKPDTIKIFLLDRDEYYLEELKEYLIARFNADIKCFTNAKECIKFLSLNPELVIIDNSFIESDDDLIHVFQTMRNLKKYAISSSIIVMYPEHELSVNGDYGFYHIARDGSEIGKIEAVLREIRKQIRVFRFKKSQTRMSMLIIGFFLSVILGSLSAYFFLGSSIQ